MTAPQIHGLPPNVCVGLRKRLRLAAVSSTALAALFTGGTIVGILVAGRLWPLGALLAVAYLVGAVLSLGVLSATRRGQHAVVADGIRITTGHRAASEAHTYTRLSRIAAGLALVAAVVLALSQADVSLAFIGLLCALPLLSLASVARGVARRITRHLA